MSAHESASLVVDDWSIDTTSGEAQRDDRQVRLEPRVLDLLVALAQRPGEVLSKEELLAHVWADTNVSDDAVWRALAKLRRALGDDPKHGRLIETLPRRGYRLNARVEWVAAGNAAHATASRRSMPAARLVGFGAAVLIGLAIAASISGDWGDRHGPAAAPSSPNAARDAREWSADELYAAGHEFYERFDERDVGRAIEFFMAALEQDPDHGLALAGLASAYRTRAIHFHEGAALLTEALGFAKRAVAVAPESAEAHKALGLVLGSRGQIDEAIESYERAIELRPDYPAAQDDLAGAYVARGRFRDGLETMLAVRPSREGLAIHLVNLGVMMAGLGDWDEAREFYEASLAADPVSDHATAGVVWTELGAGDPDAAARWIADSSADMSSVPMLNARAAVAWARDDLTGALDLLQRSVEATAPQTNNDAATRLAVLSMQLGVPWTPRLEAHAEWLELAGASGERWRDSQSWAALLVARGDHDEAIAVLERAAAHGRLDAPWLRADPMLAELRGEPRFERLIDALLAKARADLTAVRRHGGASISADYLDGGRPKVGTKSAHPPRPPTAPPLR